MTPTTIYTDRRIFEVTETEGETYLCNLGDLSISLKGKLYGLYNNRVIRIRHYWNNNFKVISKIEVMEMIELNER